jgi:hypothetical protein
MLNYEEERNFEEDPDGPSEEEWLTVFGQAADCKADIPDLDEHALWYEGSALVPETEEFPENRTDTRFVPQVNSAEPGFPAVGAAFKKAREKKLEAADETTDTIYVFWEHSPALIERTGIELADRLAGREVSQINVYFELLGPQQQRKERAVQINHLVNSAAEEEWLSYHAESYSAALERSEFSDIEGDYYYFELQLIKLLREIRNTTGATIAFKCIDLNSEDPDYKTVEEAAQARRSYLNLLRIPISEIPALDETADRGSVDPQKVVLNQLRESVVTGAKEINLRNSVLRRQLDAELEHGSHKTINLILVGSGHSDIIPDSSGAAAHLVTVIHPEELKAQVPVHLRDVLCTNIVTSILLEAAARKEINQDDLEAAVLDDLMRALLREKASYNLTEFRGGNEYLAASAARSLLSFLILTTETQAGRSRLFRDCFNADRSGSLEEAGSRVLAQLLERKYNIRPGEPLVKLFNQILNTDGYGEAQGDN